jgi:hypothetical protein
MHGDVGHRNAYIDKHSQADASSIPTLRLWIAIPNVVAPLRVPSSLGIHEALSPQAIPYFEW